MENQRSKIAIVAKAPSSRLLAPFHDESWEIWSLSDNFTVIPRWDRWFEIHDLDRYKQLYPDYYDWMCSLPAGEKPIYVVECRDEMPAGVLFPWQALMKKYGEYFTNSISWMTAFAIEELLKVDGERTVGLWGVDMATNTEYAHQRPSCEYFIGWARAIGIEVVVPDECDLMKCARPYAIMSNTGALDRKIRARQKEIADRGAKLRFELTQAERAAFATSGAMQELEQLEQRLNGQATEFIVERKKRLQEDMNNANQAREALREGVAKLEGARENLDWCKQWA